MSHAVKVQVEPDESQSLPKERGDKHPRAYKDPIEYLSQYYYPSDELLTDTEQSTRANHAISYVVNKFQPLDSFSEVDPISWTVSLRF
ncbi:MAG: hypothetical protein P9L92_13310 [Candidatus Electryonea clarkiae]|nr:hypothetical protein [Candidatus Electryonea clarkiae]MDP8288454.1 hypothetical protein [Candidatus Electryonea clarkiae]